MVNFSQRQIWWLWGQIAFLGGRAASAKGTLGLRPHFGIFPRPVADGTGRAASAVVFLVRLQRLTENIARGAAPCQDP